ncbi:hypothetical protein SADUNF_Sadunf17G0032600 [Salix dunnii]|uniref:Uncharacterized protein n=1 Tax=Salix dunnii TaxID=1413687 RepID=A0A835J590_9ROSI|nr:hypothetical protein SADUNF_Sadunf17G0032600 [Salix dunnii]
MSSEASVKVVLVNSGRNITWGAEKAWLDLSAGGIKSGAGRGFVPHSLITAVFQRLSRIDGMGRAKRERGQKEGCNTRTSQEVTHPSTTLAQARLTSEFGWDPVHSCCEFRDEISRGGAEKAWLDLSAGGIKSGAGRGFVPHSLITAVFQRLSRIDGMGSDGIRCISAGMIAPISTCRMKCYKQSSMIPQQRGEAARRCIFTGVSEE